MRKSILLLQAAKSTFDEMGRQERRSCQGEQVRGADRSGTPVLEEKDLCHTEYRQISS